MKKRKPERLCSVVAARTPTPTTALRGNVILETVALRAIERVRKRSRLLRARIAPFPKANVVPVQPPLRTALMVTRASWRAYVPDEISRMPKQWLYGRAPLPEECQPSQASRRKYAHAVREDNPWRRFVIK